MCSGLEKDVASEIAEQYASNITFETYKESFSSLVLTIAREQLTMRSTTTVANILITRMS